MSQEMDHCKTKRRQSRRSSILKPRKPRQPLENVNLNSSNENTPTTSKIKRRVSFAEKKHVKEFCHTTEQGTVWHSTYEEHDFSLKGSLDLSQNAEIETSVSKKKVYASGINCIHDILEIKANYAKSPKLTDSQPYISKTKIYKDNTESDNSDFSDQTKCIEMPDKESLHRQAEPLTTSESIKSNNIIRYRDVDEEDCASNSGNKCYSQPCDKNVNCESNKIFLRDLSMEFTTTLSRSLLPSYFDVEKNKEDSRKQDANILHQNSFDTDNITNYNNISMGITQVVPVSMRPIKSNFEISNQVSVIKSNNKDPKCESNTLITNLPLTEDIVSRQMQNVNYDNDSLELTGVVQSCTDINAFCKSDRNNTIFNASNWKHTQNIDKTEFFNDITMEMTKSVNTWKENIPYPNIKNAAESTDKIEHFNDVMMEITRCEDTYEKNISHCNEDVSTGKSIQGIKRMIDSTNKTKLFNDVAMEMTESVNVALPTSVYNHENLAVKELASKDDRTKCFHNISMEMTKAVQSKKDETSNQALYKLVHKENTSEEKDMNNSIMYVENTKLLAKPMDITEAISVPSCHEGSYNIMNRIEAKTSMEILPSQTISSIYLPKENSSELVPQSNVIINNDKTIHDMSMDITEVISVSSCREKTCNIISRIDKTMGKSLSPTGISGMHLLKESSLESMRQPDANTNNNKTNNKSMEITVAISENKSNISQNLKANNITEFKFFKSGTDVIKENSIIPEKITETTKAPNEKLPETHITLPSSNNLDHSLSITLGNDDRERMSSENENIDTEKDPSGFHMESQFSVHYNSQHLIHTLINNNAMNEDTHKECLPKNTPILDSVPILTPISNLGNSQNNIDECNFLKENLENDLVELQSIDPPSFICTSSDEESLFFNPLRKNESHISSITDTVSINNTNYNLERLKSINIECDQMKNCQVSTIADDNRRIDCQAITETVINDDRINESINCNSTDIAHLNEERLSLVIDINHRKTIDRLSGTSHFIETEMTSKNHELDKEIQNMINDEPELRDTEEKKECSKIEDQLDAEQCVDYLKETEATIENRIDRESLNDEMNVRNSKQREECVQKSFVAEQCVNAIENESSQIEQDPLLSLIRRLELHAQSEDCIWNVYHKNLSKNIIAFGFMSNSLLIVTHLSSDLNCFQEDSINEIKVVSLIADDADVLIRIVHKLILEKIDAETLIHLYKTCEDILQMLDFVSQNVKLAMDFMFDLRQLDDLNLMEITRDKISFVSHSNHMNIILKITVNVKSFDEITSNDINVRCLLGTVEEGSVKILIKYIKRDYKFLRRYMNDVKDYIDIMEETYNG